MKVGDPVRVKLPRKGGIQEGTVTRILPGDRFAWKNGCNFERVARLADLTTEAPKAATLDPYVQAWVDEDEES